MKVSCPHCGKQLKLSTKFKKNLQEMAPGKKVRVKCSQCATPFPIDPRIGAVDQPSAASVKKTETGSGEIVKPPQPPDVRWLEEGVFEDQEVVEEIPQALVLVPEDAVRSQVVKAVEGLGYRAEVVEKVENAVEKMEFVNYSSVILHVDFEEGGLDGLFHQHMCRMNMAKRRYIFYVLIGKELQTLYDLQALSCSANVIVNDTEVPYFGTILRKAIPDYEALFGPLMEEMRVQGK